jgi:hypothetical protein
MSMREVEQPVAIDRADGFDYPIRAAALRLVYEKAVNGPKHLYGFRLDDVLESPHRREILDCIASMAVGAFLEYYGGWDIESAQINIARELRLAEDLAEGEIPQ